MNNSLLSVEIEEQPIEVAQSLRARESELVRIVEAVKAVETSAEWSTLKSLVFDGVLGNLERRLASEATRSELNNSEIYKLQGQIAWAKKYSDLDTLANAFRLELINVRQRLNPPTERDIAPDTL